MLPPQRCLFADFEATLDFSVANLLAHNNISQICNCGQISFQSAAVNCSFSDTFEGYIHFAGDIISVAIGLTDVFLIIPVDVNSKSSE